MESIKLLTIYHSKKVNSNSGGVENLIHDTISKLKLLNIEVNLSYDFLNNIASIMKKGNNCIFGSYSTYLLILSTLIFIFSGKKKSLIWIPCFHPFDDQFKGRSSIIKNIKYFCFTRIIIKILLQRCIKIFYFSDRERSALVAFGAPNEIMKRVSLTNKFEKNKFKSYSRKFEVGYYGRWTKSKGSEILLQLSNLGLLSWVSSIDIPESDLVLLKNNNVSVTFFNDDNELWIQLLHTKSIVVPSLSESYGYVGVESRSAGCNVIYFDCPSIESDISGSYKVVDYDLKAWVNTIEMALQSTENIPANQHASYEYLYSLLAKEVANV